MTFLLWAEMDSSGTSEMQWRQLLQTSQSLHQSSINVNEIESVENWDAGNNLADIVKHWQRGE